MKTITCTRSRRTFLIFGLILLLCGCAETKITSPLYSGTEEYPSEELRSAFGNIAIVPLHERPNIELNATVYDEGMCAREAAASWYKGAVSGCSGIFDCLFSAVVLGPLMGAAGSATGAAEADTEEEVNSRVERIEVITGLSPIADRFRDRALELARQYDEFTFQAIPEHQNTDHHEIPFDLLRTQQIDTVLQLGITDIATRSTEAKYCDPELELSIRTSLAVFDTADSSQIYSTSMRRETESRKLEDWAKGDAKHWDAALNGYMDDVTVGLLEDVLVNIKAPADIVPTGSLSRSNVVYIQVKDRQPTFAWAWEPDDKDRWTEEFSKYNSDITYDLRVTNTRSGSIVYEKFGLTDTQHKMRRYLPQRGQFIWQVRANFSWNGKIRRTRWFGKFLLRT